MHSKTRFLFGALIITILILTGCTQNNPNNPANDQNSNQNQNNNPNGGTDLSQTVQKGDTIQVNYKGTLDDGTEFDSNLKPGRTPLEFTVGSGQMIKGFDAAVVGMKLNEEKTVTLQPSEAYGEIRSDLIKFFPKENFQGQFDQLTVGQKIYSTNGASAKVVELTKDGAKLDLNPELAGKKLTFWIKIVKIQKGT